MNRRVIQYMIAIPAMLTGCSLVGLDIQEDHQHEITILEPDIHMTAWEFLNEPREDSLRNFERMVEAIEYAGLEEEYSKPNRTFIAFTSYAILRYNSSGSVNSGCYFGMHQVPNLDEDGNPIPDSVGNPTTRPGRNWSDYPVEQVRNLLRYHIIEGEYSYHNLGPENTEAQTLSPVDTAKVMYLQVQNDRSSKIRINDVLGAVRISNARTGNLKATNGFIHVFDTFQIPPMDME